MIKTYIKEAIKLADGWEYWANDNIVVDGEEISAPYKFALDALAAQLVRQCDAIDNVDVDCHKSGCYLREWHGFHRNEVKAYGSDRATNQIRIIIDSGVLEK